MKVVFTRHAQQRMIQRKVSPEQVFETIEFPDDVTISESGETVAVKNYGNREVRVAYELRDPDTAIIFTVMNPRVHW